jgi:predicted enzyme related to lactoylglutathione lyase
MSERDTYPAGVPCWVETLQRDRRAAHAFYSSLFGWQIVVSDEDEYAVARLRGSDVAGIGSLPDLGSGLAPAWVTHIRVESADATAERTTTAGGAVLDGPFDAPPAGRLAVLADPTGALFCAWQADIREGAELVNEPSAWAMSALQTTEPARAAEFYRAVFGWEAESYGPVQLLRLPGYVGGTPEQPVPRDLVAVMAPLDDPSARSRWDVDFWVQDTEVTAGHAVELGGRLVVPPHDRPPFRSAVLADPGGAAFSISQLVAGSPERPTP